MRTYLSIALSWYVDWVGGWPAGNKRQPAQSSPSREEELTLSAVAEKNGVEKRCEIRSRRRREERENNKQTNIKAEVSNGGENQMGFQPRSPIMCCLSFHSIAPLLYIWKMFLSSFGSFLSSSYILLILFYSSSSSSVDLSPLELI